LLSPKVKHRLTQDWIDGRFEGMFKIAEQIFPTTIPRTGANDEWLIAGPGLIARATRTLHAIHLLKNGGFEADGYTLLRSLYEHVTRFAWLAVDPPKHLPLWLKWIAKSGSRSTVTSVR
jgi:hypothetical protein